MQIHSTLRKLRNLANSPEYRSVVEDLEKRLVAEMETIGLSEDLLPGKAPTGKAETSDESDSVASETKKQKKKKANASNS